MPNNALREKTSRSKSSWPGTAGAGRTLDRCYDLRGDLTATKLRVTGLHVGRKAWLAHLGAGSGGALSVVRWEAVVRIEGDRIVVRDDASDR